MLRGRIVDFERLSLFADSPEAGKRARFQFGVREVNPRVTVFTNVSGAANGGIISGPMDAPSFNMFLDMLEQVAKGDSGNKNKVVCKYPVYVDNKPTDDVKILSELWFGKNAEGIVWLALTAEGQPKITFEFRGSKFVDFYHKDGTVLSEAEKSVMCTKAYISLLRELVPLHIHGTSCEDKPPRENFTKGKGKTNAAVPAGDFDELTY